MKRMLGVVAVLILLASGCGDGGTSEGDPTAETTSATPTATTTTTEPPAAGPLVVSPGGIGVAKVGMTKAQATQTGLFDADVETGDDGCQAVIPLRWKAEFGDIVDVLTDESGAIASMGVRAAGPKTAAGIGIGSTLSQLQAAHADVSPIEAAGFGQAGSFVQSGDDWLGFLFDESPDDVTDGSKITFMEVTQGGKPELMRDGC